jgi:hypothetical protein
MQLIRTEAGTTQKIKQEEADKLPTGPLESEIPNPNNVWISLHMIDNGQILPISERNEFTMGRISENQPIMPDVDFSAFKAYENGVSRLHAVIRRNNSGTIVMDLGSSNGTYVNGTRLMPNMEQPLRHGDIISLGKLKMQVVLL